jgi:peptidoglycan/xylan/chitin deacetylase (PgdA/CDA1 family)
MNPIRLTKTFIKRIIQLTAIQLGRHKRTPQAPEIIILMYHRILPLSDKQCRTEEPGMVVSPETFRNHIQILAKYYEFISLSDWIERKNTGLKLPLKACAITFDDGWADNYYHAYPILKELKVPATIFLVANMINTNQTFWPERLAALIYKLSEFYPDESILSHPDLQWLINVVNDSNYVFSNHKPSREELSDIISSAKKYSDEEINNLLDKIEKSLGLNMNVDNEKPLLSWSQTNEMLASGIIDTGSHTCHHIRLTSTTPVETLEKEIIKSKEIIESKTKKEVKLFCFPNGDFSDKALDMVKKHYCGSVTTQMGWNEQYQDIYRLKRISIHEDISNDKASFLSRISGWT